MIQFSGYPGASVQALIKGGLSDVYDFEPDLVILDIGTLLHLKQWQMLLCP